MIVKKFSKERLKNAIFGSFFAIMMILSGVSGLLLPGRAYAEPEEYVTTEEVVEVTEPVESVTTEETVEATEPVESVTANEAEKAAEPVERTANDNTESKSFGIEILNADEKSQSSCSDSIPGIGWLVCPATGVVSKAVDWLYKMIRQFLVINPITAEDGQPVYEVWKHLRNITNIIFIIFFLVIIYSQITGYGINNYGIKKALPKLIVAVVLVNLSFIICSLLVDLSNIIGMGLRGIFESVEASVAMTANVDINMADLFSALAGGIAIAGIAIMFDAGAIFMFVPLVLGAFVSVLSGLVTIALRQAVVVVLVMLAPLAMVANVLPNTEPLFVKWKKLLTRMLVFYPMFSLLFGASHLVGWSMIASARDGVVLLLGVAVQILPLFLSWSLMKMSGTILETANNLVRRGFDRPLAKTNDWATAKRAQTNANRIAKGATPSAKLMQYLQNRQALREEDTKNAQNISKSKSFNYVQRKISGTEIGDTTSRTGRASKVTQNAKEAKNLDLVNKNAAAHTEHVLGNYNKYYSGNKKDDKLSEEGEKAWLDYGRAQYIKEIDEENDIDHLIYKFTTANKRDANNNPLDPDAFQRYISSVAGPGGEERVWAKIISQAARVESKQRAEHHVAYGKIGHNGFNKKEYRSFMVGYMIDADGYAVDMAGKRLKYPDGSLVETIPGEALTKAPEKLVLYNKRDEHGLYYDMKDQSGNIIARVHRGTGADGRNHDDAAFIKETLANFEIPIGDPINNIYNILSGVNPGSIHTKELNDIGLSRYSTTIGGAMKAYKGDAAWAGAMFNAVVSNRQMKNAAQHAIWALDSIAKTARPGAMNQQSPSSVRYLKTILDPDNWDKIFRDEDLASAINIDNELVNGEDWILDSNGNIVDNVTVENPSHEQRMNRVKRKYLIPAMKKILPSLDRLRTSETLNNQKQGTADAQYEFLKMVEEKWENNDNIPFDPTLVEQDVQAEARAFRERKHDRDGNLLYRQNNESGRRSSRPRPTNLRVTLQSFYDQSMVADELRDSIALELGRHPEYGRALERFEELCDLNPEATIDDIRDWFDELCVLAEE